MESKGNQFLEEDSCSSNIVSLYRVDSIVWSERTKYAEAVLADIKGLGRCLFLDKEIQSASEDEDIYHECLVHPVMMAATSREKVLVIGGGEGATVREVLKWQDVSHVDWVDIDGEVVEACKKYLPWSQEAAYTDPRVHFVAEDIRSFFKRTDTKYNVIIIDLPDPDPEENPLNVDCLLNRAFWQSVQTHLTKGGVWVSHTGPVRRRGPSGAKFIRRATAMADICSLHMTEYHAVIPSFQDDWGWIMSCRSQWCTLPFPTRFLNYKSFNYIFQWPYTN